MTSFFVVAIIVVLVALVVYNVLQHREGIVARRGLSIGADLGTLGDRPRVRIAEMTPDGPDRVRLVLSPEPPTTERPPLEAADLHLVVLLREEDFGFGLLQTWQRSASWLALVLPPGSRLVRLRSIDDLQPLTLSRAG